MNNEPFCLQCKVPFQKGDSVRHGLHATCFTKTFSVQNSDEDFVNLNRETAASRDPSLTAKSTSDYRAYSFFHGKYRKYSGQLGKEHYILKVCDKEAPALPEVEFLSNQIARLLGVDVPDFALINFNGERAFVTKNFVKKYVGGANLVHIYHYLTKEDELSCEVLCNRISELTARFIDIEKFIHICLFDSLIGNHDRHGRNLGFLVTHKTTRLAPAYDNPSELGIEPENFLEAHLDPRGKIYTSSSKEPTTKDYIEEFERLGYADSIRVFCKKLDENKIIGLIEASLCSEKMKKALKRLFRRRYEEIPEIFLPKRA